MRNLLRRFPLVLALSGVLPMWGCSHSDAPAPGFYQVVAISDIHFNPLYDPTLYSSLVAADPGDWPGVFETSAVTAPAADGTDTNYPLLQLALADIKRHMGASPVVLFTGDLLGHNIPTLFCDASKNQAPNTPCTPSPAVAAMIPPFIDKTFSFVAAQIRAAAGDAPVIYVPGNIDTYGPGLGPDSTFLTNNGGWPCFCFSLVSPARTP